MDEPKTKDKSRCCKIHLNSAGSVWYGIIATALQLFILYRCSRSFYKFLLLNWSGGVPNTEVNTYLGLVGGVALALPFFLIATLCKVGNLANDGYQLGQDLSTCSSSPGILGQHGGVVGSMWRHGPPTSGVIHVTSAFACLLAKMVMDARMLREGYMDEDSLWSTDLSLFFNTTTPANASAPALGFIHPMSLEEFTTWQPPSLEFINFFLALTWMAVRVANVYWAMSKPLGIIFTVHLMANVIHALISHCGITILYRIHVKYTGNYPISGMHNEPFLLDSWTTVMLYSITVLVVQGSQSILAMYGLQRLSAYVGQIRRKHLIRLANPRSSLWSYFPQIAASCVLLALAACEGPLLYDLSKLYKASKNLTILIAVGVMICHAFLWFALWLILSACRHWSFRIRVGVAKHALYSAPAVRLAVDLELTQPGQKPYAQGKTEYNPMVVLMRGRALNVNDPDLQNLILNQVERHKSGKQLSPSDEQIYWLRSGAASPKQSPVSEVPSGSRIKKNKVTFEDSILESETSALLPPPEDWRRDGAPEDGDYAILRKLPLVALPEESEIKLCSSPLLRDSPHDRPTASTPLNHVEVHGPSPGVTPLTKLCDITDSGCEDSASTGSPPSSTSNGSSGYVSRHSDVIDDAAMKRHYAYTQPTVPTNDVFELPPPPPPYMFENAPATPHGASMPPPVPPHYFTAEPTPPPPPVPPHGSPTIYNSQNRDNFYLSDHSSDKACNPKPSSENPYGTRNNPYGNHHPNMERQDTQGSYGSQNGYEVRQENVYGTRQDTQENYRSQNGYEARQENVYGTRQAESAYGTKPNQCLRQENPYGNKQSAQPFSYTSENPYSVRPQEATQSRDSTCEELVPPPIPKHYGQKVHIQGGLSVGVNNHFQTFPHQRVTPAPPIVRYNDTIAVSPRASFYKNRESIYKARKDVIPCNGLNAPAPFLDNREVVQMQTFAPRK